MEEENLNLVLLESKPQHAAPKNFKPVYEILEIFITALLLVGLLFSVFFRTAGVNGESMWDTLHDQDYLLLSRFFYVPERGDIVVLNRYHYSLSRVEEPLIKRVIGLAGDTVKVTPDAVYVNGKKLEEEYVHYVNDPTFEEATVPEGCVFVLGDHRNQSKDSRLIGFVDVEDIMGKAVLRLTPSFGGIYQEQD